jgi:hypothetical protein
MQKVLYGVICIIGFSVSLMHCDSSTQPDDNMPDNGKNIQVVYPKGGESFSVDQTVTIQFKINADKVAGVIPAISKNGGMSWDDITNQQVTAGPGGGGQLLTCPWIIGQEVNPVTYDTILTNCKIKVSNYNLSTEFDVSGVFTVNP